MWNAVDPDGLAAPTICGRIAFAENRFPLFRAML
jgi:hypothetical protein